MIDFNLKGKKLDKTALHMILVPLTGTKWLGEPCETTAQYMAINS
jgi:hypothetical protein